MSRIKYFFSVPKRLQILTIALVIFVPIWLSLPGMTEDMSVRPWYYLWSKGLLSINTTILNDFSRDSEYQKALVGKPVGVLIPLFPEFTKASKYDINSERYKYSQKLSLKYQKEGNSIYVDDIYWLSGDKNYADGFYVITSNGKIIKFHLLKG
ncbi:MAG: hypothetical protein ACFCAD_09960 [Pleurocapsa sp.]